MNAIYSLHDCRPSAHNQQHQHVFSRRYFDRQRPKIPERVVRRFPNDVLSDRGMKGRTLEWKNLRQPVRLLANQPPSQPNTRVLCAPSLIRSKLISKSLELGPQQLPSILHSQARTMPLIVYGLMYSPPVRAVLLTAQLLDVPYELKEVDLLKGDHLKPEYLKINPLHTVPAINDDGFILSESHAIVLYLIAKYSKDDSLYLKDIKKQAIINQRLYFDATTLFPRLPESVRGLKTTGSIPEAVLTKVTESLKLLEILLGDEKWIGGTPNYSIADICLLSTLENYTAVLPGKVESHGKLSAWLQRGRDTIEGYEEITRSAIQGLAQLFAKKENIPEILKFIAN